MSKTAVIYHYYDCNENVDFFLRKGGLIEDENCDFFFISNKNKNLIPRELTKGFSNIKFFNRENINIDFGGYGDLIHSDIFEEDEYDHFVFLNETSCGPFLTSRDKDKPWYEYFTNKINKKTKIFGSSLMPWFSGDFMPHVQSWCFCLDRIGLEIGKASGVFIKNEKEISHAEIVFKKEVRLSNAILQNGYNMDCFNPHYMGIDWQKGINWSSAGEQLVDTKEFPYFALFGACPEEIISSVKARNERGYQAYDPFETIFIKRSKFHSNRNIDEVFKSFYDRYKHYGEFNSVFDMARSKFSSKQE